MSTSPRPVIATSWSQLSPERQLILIDAYAKKILEQADPDVPLRAASCSGQLPREMDEGDMGAYLGSDGRYHWTNSLSGHCKSFDGWVGRDREWPVGAIVPASTGYDEATGEWRRAVRSQGDDVDPHVIHAYPALGQRVVDNRVVAEGDAASCDVEVRWIVRYDDSIDGIYAPDVPPEQRCPCLVPWPGGNPNGTDAERLVAAAVALDGEPLCYCCGGNFALYPDPYLTSGDLRGALCVGCSSRVRECTHVDGCDIAAYLDAVPVMVDDDDDEAIRFDASPFSPGGWHRRETIVSIVDRFEVFAGLQDQIGALREG